jgi:hypothetical protein
LAIEDFLFSTRLLLNGSVSLELHPSHALPNVDGIRIRTSHGDVLSSFSLCCICCTCMQTNTTPTYTHLPTHVFFHNLHDNKHNMLFSNVHWCILYQSLYRIKQCNARCTLLHVQSGEQKISTPLGIPTLTFNPSGLNIHHPFIGTPPKKRRRKRRRGRRPQGPKPYGQLDHDTKVPC